MSDKEKKLIVGIDGMHCQSCEVLIERNFKEVEGVKSADVRVSRGSAVIICDGDRVPSTQTLEAVIRDHGYTIRSLEEEKRMTSQASWHQRPSIFELIALFSVIYILGTLLAKIGILNQSFSVSGEITFAAAVVLGLVAGSSSCLAVAGGLLLSASAAYNERYGGGGSAAERIRPAVFFVFGRVVSYGVFGAIIGFVGKSLLPSPFITGALTVLAALYMLIMGLDMLGLAPTWIKGILPRMPKFLGHKILDAEGKENPFMLFVLGGATFFLPCGFTQALQIYALTTGSSLTSGLVLAGFAVGTIPALLALGWASSSLKGQVGYWFFRFSGALVIMLGLLNIQNGLTATGFDPSGFFAGANVANAQDPNVRLDGETQVIKMKIGVDPFYSPSDHYTVKAGIPVRMEIYGQGTGCRSIFQIPKAGVSVPLNKDVNIVEFTPKEPGNLVFSCSMGMFPGKITVL